MFGCYAEVKKYDPVWDGAQVAADKGMQNEQKKVDSL